MFLQHYQQQLLACDFFTVETLSLQTLYVLFFIHHATRQVYIAGCTAHPNSAWVTQQARQLIWELQENDISVCFLIRDNDKKFSASFETVFQAEAIQILRTPFQAPNANAIAERWVRSIREECLDHLIILNAAHLYSVLKEYSHYYNACRPHQGLQGSTPIPLSPPDLDRRIYCHKVLGGDQ